MTARELRIGNIVSFSNDGDGSFEQSSIDLGDFSFFSYIENNFERHYQPIPLTEDWFLKFGFEQNISYYTWERNGFGIDCYAHLKGFYYQSQKCEIKHVHQLQNLFFALTGEELNIIYKIWKRKVSQRPIKN